MPYVIKDWDKNFENAQSRKVEQLQWVPLPNKHDGKGFRRIAAMAKRCEILSGWVLVVELASKMPVRGVLADADGDLTCTDMAIKTGFPESIFTIAIEALKDPKIGWVFYERRSSTTGSALPEKAPQLGVDSQQLGAEGKGMEGNGKDSCASRRVRFDDFWTSYPKKRSKGDAEKAWKKVNPSEELVGRILKAVDTAKTSEGWIKENGKFIPYPASWLNSKGWEDEIISVGNGVSSGNLPSPKKVFEVLNDA